MFMKTTDSSKFTLSLVLIVISSACVSGTKSGISVARDSSGVTIVESHSPSWGRGDRWRIEAEPLLSIGVDLGPEEFQFSDIGGVLLLDDGEVAVADGGTREIRFFDSSGTHTRTVGGNGEGPGEFRSINGLGRSVGDSIWAYDFWLSRVTVFDSEGNIGRVTRLDADIPRLMALGQSHDGEFFFVQSFSSVGVAAETSLGLARHPVALTAFGGDGVFRDTIGLYPGREIVLKEEAGRLVMSTPPFAHNAVAAFGGNHVYVGAADSYEIFRLNTSGTLRQVIRRPEVNLDITETDKGRWIEKLVAAADPASQVRLRSELEALQTPTTKPAYSDFLVDGTGHLWVAEFVHVADKPRNWDVFSPDGVWMGTVEMPESFTPFDITTDRVAGVVKDEYDVERVELLRLKK